MREHSLRTLPNTVKEAPHHMPSDEVGNIGPVPSELIMN